MASTIIHINLETCVHKRSHEKLETLYVNHYNVYGRKTYQRTAITQGAPVINLHSLSMRWSCEVTLHLHLQKTHEHRTRQGTDLQ